MSKIAKILGCILGKKEFSEDVSRDLGSEIMAMSVDAILGFDETFHVRYANPSALRLFRYDPGSLDGCHLSCLIPQDRRRAHRAMADGFVTSGETARIMGSRAAVRGLCSDGTQVPLDISILKHKPGARWRFTAIARDITTHIEAEVEAIEAEVEAERSLAGALDALAHSTRARAAFFASVSHELRTPLNAVIGFADILRGEGVAKLPPAQLRDYAGHIADSGRHLLFLLDDIIATATLESGSSPIAEAEIALDDLCIDAAADLSRRGTTAIAVDAASCVHVRGDPDLLKRALVRVLECLANAGTFEGMSIAARACGEGATISVAHPREFDLARFPLIGMRYGRSISGFSDLGLYLAERIFELHGGRLGIDSRPGAGMRVTLSLPRKRVLAPSSIDAA